MMRLYRYLAPLAGALMLVACGNTDGDTTDGGTDGTTDGGGTAGEEIHIGQSIMEDTTWAAGSVYVVDGFTYVKARLTIEPGVTVLFASGAHLQTANAGVIIALGTADEPIVFTSLSGVSGAWPGLMLNGATSQFAHCRILNAVKGLEVGFNTAVSVVNSELAWCTDAGLDASQAVDGTVVTGNAFYGNQVPVRISGEVSIDASNVFSKTIDDEVVTNVQNGIFTGDTIKKSVSWTNTEVPFVVTEFIYLNDNLTLTLGAGTVVKFFPGTYISQKAGSTIAAFDGATLTAYADDSRLGDTAADGASDSIAADYWNGIKQPDGSWLDSQTSTNMFYATATP